MRGVDIPTRTVGAGFVAAMAVGLLVLSIPAIRARVGRIPLARAVLIIALVWSGVALALVILATPWWLILLNH